MNTQNNQPIKIDFLKLSDSEKAKPIKRTKEAIRKRIEEAKFWCPLTETGRNSRKRSTSRLVESHQQALNNRR
jgi:hypothetical protein